MQYDRKIILSTSGSRFGPWTPQTVMLSEFYTRLSVPVRSTEIRAAYLALPKKKQDELKDVGGFVGGELAGRERRSGLVKGRDLITLDIDKVSAGGTQDVLKRLASLGCGYVCYSTRKHGPESPRLRAIIPIDRTVTADEYEPLARKAAQYIDASMQIFDRTTFQPERLMYFPSCSQDSEYVYFYEDKPFLNAEGVLAGYTGEDGWRNVRHWPQCPDELDIVRKTAEKQADPTTKEGIIGAFCRVYDIHAVMEKFIPGVYEQDVRDEDRFTFVGGSTSGGAILYQNGLFLYSHHATDPAGGKLCNAFDLVRLHLYGEEDADAKPGTPVGRMPSYIALCKSLQSDKAVYEQLQKDRMDHIREDFGDFIDKAPEDVTEGAQESTGDALVLPGSVPSPVTIKGRKFKVELNQDGSPKKTMDNAWALLETDPMLQGRIVLDVFAGRGVAKGPYPWDDNPEERVWTDNDDNGVQWYLEKYHDYRSKQDVLAALSLCGNHHQIDPVKAYLESLPKWDGVKRLDTLFIDYLGAEDNIYTRAVTRKAFVAAVARTFQPGIKFDWMTILTGPQGVGKSTLLQRMGRQWFSDNLQNFEGKDAKELIQGVWIVEVGELGYMNKTEANQIKQFLSVREDTYRAAYGRNTQTKPRRCVFFGTTNEDDYLKDATGDRRFWPVDIAKQDCKYDIFSDLTDEVVSCIWAEALTRYRMGEPLHLSAELEKIARGVQEAHKVTDAREGLILNYLDEEIPEGFEAWSEDQKKSWENGMLKAAGTSFKMEKRDKICAAEVWEKVLKSDLKYMSQQDSRVLNNILRGLKGWAPIRTNFGKYGIQRGFRRTTYTLTLD